MGKRSRNDGVQYLESPDQMMRSTLGLKTARATTYEDERNKLGVFKEKIKASY